MKVFELYFNPKNERKISESFQYKPKDAYEGKLGRIYLIGEISDPESRDRSFLQNIFHVTKEHFYKNTSLSPEKALKETLQEVNDFIAKNKYGDRLSVVIISSKNFDLNLAKIGRIKIFLLKKEKAKDYADVTAKDIHSKSILVPRDQLHIILSQLDFLESSLEFECLNVSGGELVWVEKEQGFGQVIETDMSVDEINYHVKVKLWNDENKTFRLDDIKTVTAPSGTEPNYNPCDIAGLSKKKDNEDDIDEE